MEAITAGLLVILVILIVAGIFLYFRHRARMQALKKKYGHKPQHVELYFEEYFEEMIDSWDLVGKDDAREWADQMNQRLEGLSNEIEGIKTKRGKLDSDMDKVEDRIAELEARSSKVDK